MFRQNERFRAPVENLLQAKWGPFDGVNSPTPAASCDVSNVRKSIKRNKENVRLIDGVRFSPSSTLYGHPLCFDTRLVGYRAWVIKQNGNRRQGPSGLVAK